MNELPISPLLPVIINVPNPLSIVGVSFITSFPFSFVAYRPDLVISENSLQRLQVFNQIRLFLATVSPSTGSCNAAARFSLSVFIN